MRVGSLPRLRGIKGCLLSTCYHPTVCVLHRVATSGNTRNHSDGSLTGIDANLGSVRSSGDAAG